MKYLLVFSTVFMTVASGLILDYTAIYSHEHNELLSIMVIFLLGCAVLVNVLKFFVWGRILEHYTLSESYPLTSLFFPLIFLVAWYKSYTEPTLDKILGMVLIMLGLIIFESKTTTKTDES